MRKYTNTTCLKDPIYAIFLKICCLTDWLIRTLAEMLPNSWKSSGSKISIMIIISSYQFDGVYRRPMDAIFFEVWIRCHILWMSYLWQRSCELLMIKFQLQSHRILPSAYTCPECNLTCNEAKLKHGANYFHFHCPGCNAQTSLRLLLFCLFWSFAGL